MLDWEICELSDLRGSKKEGGTRRLSSFEQPLRSTGSVRLVRDGGQCAPSADDGPSGEQSSPILTSFREMADVSSGDVKRRDRVLIYAITAAEDLEARRQHSGIGANK